MSVQSSSCVPVCVKPFIVAQLVATLLIWDLSPENQLEATTAANIPPLLSASLCMKKYVMLIHRVGGWILHVRIFCLFIHSYLKEILRVKHHPHYGCPALNCEVRCLHAHLVQQRKKGLNMTVWKVESSGHSGVNVYVSMWGSRGIVSILSHPINLWEHLSSCSYA